MNSQLPASRQTEAVEQALQITQTDNVLTIKGNYKLGTVFDCLRSKAIVYSSSNGFSFALCSNSLPVKQVTAANLFTISKVNALVLQEIGSLRMEVQVPIDIRDQVFLAWTLERDNVPVLLGNDIENPGLVTYNSNSQMDWSVGNYKLLVTAYNKQTLSPQSKGEYNFLIDNEETAFVARTIDILRPL